MEAGHFHLVECSGFRLPPNSNLGTGLPPYIESYRAEREVDRLDTLMPPQVVIRPSSANPTMTRANQRHTTDDLHKAVRGSELVGDGRVNLYAGFCARRVPRRVCAGGGHPSGPAVAGRL